MSEVPAQAPAQAQAQALNTFATSLNLGDNIDDLKETIQRTVLTVHDSKCVTWEVNITADDLKKYMNTNELGVILSTSLTEGDTLKGKNPVALDNQQIKEYFKQDLDGNDNQLNIFFLLYLYIRESEKATKEVSEVYKDNVFSLKLPTGTIY